MAAPTTGNSAPGRQEQINQERAQIEEDFRLNMQMNSLQRQSQQNNTFVTAQTALENDDVLRAMANNLK